MNKEIYNQGLLLYNYGISTFSHNPIPKEIILKILYNAISECVKVDGSLCEIKTPAQAKFIIKRTLEIIFKNLPSPGTRYGLILATKLTSQNTQRQLDNKSLVTADSKDKKKFSFNTYSDLYQLTDDPTLYLYVDLPNADSHPLNKNVKIKYFEKKKDVTNFNLKGVGYQYFYATGNNKKHINNFCGPRIMYFNAKKLYYMQTQGKLISDPTLKKDVKVDVILKFMCLSNDQLICFNRSGMQKNKFLNNFSTVSFESTASALSLINDEIQDVDDIPSSLYFGLKVPCNEFDLLDK